MCMIHVTDKSRSQAKELGDELFDLQKRQRNARDGEVYVLMTAQERIDFVRRQERISEIFMLLAHQTAA
jgi:hypothetical protein